MAVSLHDHERRIIDLEVALDVLRPGARLTGCGYGGGTRRRDPRTGDLWSARSRRPARWLPTQFFLLEMR